MFTGIIETMAEVVTLQKEASNLHLTFKSAITGELKIDQSVSHNGVCLTVVKINGNEYTVTAIDETLQKSNLGILKVGELVNLERCMPANGRFDGHIVQGHVDTTAKCTGLTDKEGSWEFQFDYAPRKDLLTVAKGSITVNGVSLTVVNSDEGRFTVHVIPYTYEHTSFSQIKIGSTVNLEFDIVGKYVAKLLARKQ
jgi:riboflavin synthase